MPQTLQVILQSDVDNVGKSGELVKVRPGFARNFLLPRQLAVPATAGQVNRLAHDKAVALAKAEKAKAGAREAAKKIEALSIKLSLAAGEDGRLFGAVTTKEIAEAAKAAGAELDRKKLTLDEPIKALGTYTVPVKLLSDVVANLKVEVVAK